MSSLKTASRKRKPVKRLARRRKAVIATPTVAVERERPWTLSQEEVTIVKNSIAKGASDEELKFCLTVAKRYRLDPFKQQIWFVKRWDKEADDGRGGKGANVWTPQVGINGLLFVAARDHKNDFGSVSLPEYGPMVQVDKFKAPEWARVKVWKKGEQQPTEAQAWWDEYAPLDMSKAPFWRKMPRRMIAKCATALAIRQAYPDLGGLYIPEECEKMNAELTPGGRQIIERGAIGTVAAAQAVALEKLGKNAAGTPMAQLTAGDTGQPKAASDRVGSQPQTTGTVPQPPPEEKHQQRAAASVTQKVVEIYPAKLGDVDILAFVDSPALAFLCDNGLKDITVWAPTTRVRYCVDDNAFMALVAKVAGSMGVTVKRVAAPKPTGAPAAPELGPGCMAAPKAQIPPFKAPAAPAAAVDTGETINGKVGDVRPHQGRSPLHVDIGGVDCTCWHKHVPGTEFLLADVFTNAKGQVAVLKVTRTEKAGKQYTNIEAIKRIGNREYDENGPVRNRDDMGQAKFF